LRVSRCARARARAWDEHAQEGVAPFESVHVEGLVIRRAALRPPAKRLGDGVEPGEWTPIERPADKVDGSVARGASASASALGDRGTHCAGYDGALPRASMISISPVSVQRATRLSSL